MALAFFSWQQALLKSDEPALMKYILLVLGTHMDQHGKSCFPSLDLLERESGMSRPTIVKYLHGAEKKGWISSEKHGFSGQRWARKEYFVAFPPPEGSKPDEPPFPERQLTSEQKAVKEVNSNYPEISPIESSLRSVFGSGRETPEGKESEQERRESAREKKEAARNFDEIAKECFEEFWAAYPNKAGKKKCLPKYIKILRDKEATPFEIFSGLSRYKKNKPADRQWLNPLTFLNQARWEDEPAAPEEGRKRSINEVMGVRP